MDKGTCSSPSSSSPCHETQKRFMVDCPDQSKCFGMKIETVSQTTKRRKLSGEERKKHIEERKIKNRVSAQLSREKKAKYLENLQKEYKKLNEVLKENNQKIKSLSSELEKKDKKINSLEEELRITKEEKEYFKKNFFSSAKKLNKI